MEWQSYILNIMNNMTAFFTRWSTFWSRIECERGTYLKTYACLRDFGRLLTILASFSRFWFIFFDFGQFFAILVHMHTFHVITSFTLFFGPKSRPPSIWLRFPHVADQNVADQNFMKSGSKLIDID